MRELGQHESEPVRVRRLREDDLDRILRIDRLATHRTRREYYLVKIGRALYEPRLVVSLVAEVDARVVGFLFATLYYGEYGRADSTAVLEAIGVDPDVRGSGVGSALVGQLEANLRALSVERIETQVEWAQRELLAFMAGRGFVPSGRLCLQLDLTGRPSDG